MIAGWGSTKRKISQANFSPALQEADVPIWNLKKCIKSYRKYQRRPRIEPNHTHICAGSSKKDSCFVSKNFKIWQPKKKILKQNYRYLLPFFLTENCLLTDFILIYEKEVQTWHVYSFSVKFWKQNNNYFAFLSLKPNISFILMESNFITF